MLLGVLEMFSLDLIFLMLASGALVGAATNALGAPLPVQIIAAAVASLLMLFALRPFLLRQLRARTSLVETNSAALVGRAAVVVAPTDLVGGRVKLAGEVWSARTADERTSFTAVLDDVRRHEAHRYLTTTDLPLARVARLVGVAEQAVLTRLARRWWDRTPAAVRREARTAQS